ncbi:MAG TPA: L,D-transpeptidase family protein [Ilumatobacteraceae bacterium]
MMSSPNFPTPRPASAQRKMRQSAVVGILLASVACGGIVALAANPGSKSIHTAQAASDPANSDLDDTAAPTTTGALAATPTTAAGTATPTVADGLTDLDGGDPTAADSGTCTLSVQDLRVGSSGADVTCLQSALKSAGYYTGTVNASFDAATLAAVKSMQNDRGLFVDGVVGRESAISLSIWHDEQADVIHTPKPAPGAKDLMGYVLSDVAVSGPDAPPLPPNSGTGKRLVYSRDGQRVWAVDAHETVIRSWLVSGSKYNNEVPGKHVVYSRSEQSTAWNGQAILPHMVRYTKTKIGNIGFHGIPRHVADGTVYETDDQLGTRLSGGCTRQADLDADFVWDFAQIGTTVMVI